MPDFSKMTQAEFDAILERRVGAMSSCEILAVSGCYEGLFEALNNAILDEWAESQPDIHESQEDEEGER